MEAYEALLTRRSVRKFQERPVADDTVEKIVTAAMHAPSAVNKQPWHFVLIDDPGLLSEIPSFHPFAKMAASAPIAILVCADPELAHGPGYIPQDCAAATQNILIAAHAMGLGAVWCGVYSQPEREAGFRRLLSLPESIVPFSLVVIGYPAEQPAQADRFQADRIHRNRW
ncbi:MAG: nitroreductase family protein [Spirochaetaceae bacterium]|nr:MAG: nitroreductase family protein [Spirochaetaceae bacterium]